MQWALAMQKHGLPMRLEMITQKASEIHYLMFGSMRSVGLVGQGWCD